MQAPTPPLLLAFPAAIAALLLAAPATAQLGKTHPGEGYFASLDELYEGSFRRAERGMQSELRTAVKTIDSRWIDSIIYAGGLGEALYQQGRLADALVQFDAAIDLFLQQDKWLGKVRFQQDPREDTAIPRRLPAWSQTGRRAPYASVPRSFLYAIGQINNSQTYQQGGVVQQAQFWKLDAEELAHSFAWTLYRRGELLGPLGAIDPRAKAVADRLAGGGVGVAGHWSGAWVELWWGLAEASRGQTLAAAPHLEAGALLGGSFDHRLAAIAWLAKGQLALGAGDATADQAFAESLRLAVAYDEPGVAAEAVRGWANASNAGAATGPPLPGVIDWADRNGFALASITARLLAAEGAASAGSPAEAQGAFRRARDAANGLLGREADRLVALAAAVSAPREAGLAAARQAIAAQTTMSRRRLQVALATRWFDTGTITPRVARQAFAGVLADPSGYDWLTAPLDALAWSAAPEIDAFDRWFAAAEEAGDASLALVVIDRQRRREALSAYPLAGREVAARWLLEAPDGSLPPDAQEARAAVEAATPDYLAARQAGATATRTLREALAARPADGTTPAIKKAADGLLESIGERERIVMRVALSRVATPFAFPPPLDLAAGRAALAPGQALLAFHTSRGEVFGVVFTAAGEHLWRIGPEARVGTAVERLLRAVAGSSPKKAWTDEDLESNEWEASAAALADLLLADSRLDAASLQRLWVVPDGALWRAPLALLPIPGANEPAVRLGDVPLTIAPTPGWALRPRAAASVPSGPAAVWRLAADPAAEQPWDGIDPLEAIAGATAPPTGFDAAVALAKGALDAAVLDLGDQSLAANPLGIALTPPVRRGGRSAAAWSALPLGGPPSVALVGLGGGGPGGAGSRRAKGAPSVGAPELHLSCALLAGGVQNALIERWPTRGARSRELVAEWLNGLARLDAAAAWRRSAELGRPKPLDPATEPRLDLHPGDTPTAEHPFWWAGYYVID